jgi:drug/metabolite transporter (DMT)-like permease
VLVAIAAGMSAGMAAMLVGLQPILTVVLARVWLGERVVPRQWLGLALGLAGVWLVVRHKVALTGDGNALAAILLALVGISVGTLYQKRYCSHVDLRSGAFLQFTACAIAYAPIVLAFEPAPVRWTPEFAFALGWAVIVLSVGAISLLYWLLRHGAASNVAGLFFLVPAVTALMAWLLFGETLDALAIAGMGLISVGVALARQMRDPVTP